MSEEAFAPVGPAVARTPQLVITRRVACLLDALALGLVQTREVGLEEHPLLATRAVHDEDLGGRLRLDDDVLDLGGGVGEAQLVPREGLIP